MTQVWLVATRELTTRVRQKSFLISTAVVVLLTVAGVLVAGLAGGSSDTGEAEPARLGLTPSAAALAAPLETAGAALGVPITPVSLAEGVGADALDSESLAAVVSLSDDGAATALVHEDLDATLNAVLTQALHQLVLSEQVTALGGDPAAVSAALAGAVVEVDPIDADPQDGAPAVDPARLALAGIVGMLLYVALVFGGQMLAQGVVEEKSSRIVELLLATMKPWQLLAGKTLGIGLLGLAQVLLVVVAALVSAQSVGLMSTYDLPLGAIAASGAIWFVVGYASYALLMAGLASMVSRQEEVSSVVTPALVVMMLSYILALVVAPSDPSSGLVVACSWLPFTAPLVMPVLAALGTVSAAAQWGALAVNVAFLPLLAWLAGRVYGVSVLRTGARVRLREALRASRRSRAAAAGPASA